ncbi:MAG: N,N-dimethylformamidase beta subunit family domain-containing protein, partial [Acidimicrobiales bacterium]
MPEGAGKFDQERARIPPAPLIDRRQFLQGAVLAAGGLGSLAMGKKGHRIPAHAKHHPKPAPAVVDRVLDSGVIVPTARWVVEENAKAGTNNWVVTGVQTPHAIEGFASQVSAIAGDDVELFVNTSAQSFHVEAYRMGYYQGLAGRLIETSDTVAGAQQGAPTVTPVVNTVSCPWNPSLTLRVTSAWPPGNYLLKLVGSGSEQQYIPLTVRDDTSRAAYVVQNSVTTWQAYNLWGSYSLYYGTEGTGQDFANRARIVSFDRPYPQTWAQGAADFFGNEFPLIYNMERLGLDVTYWTDVDLHARPNLLSNHKALFSLGHDEYWSLEMRQGAQKALDKGTNLAFLGANACYRQIRLDSSAVGANRLQTCYKSAAEDPLSRSQPSLTTVN